MADLTTNINQTISDFNSIKNAIINKGINVPDNTPTNKYGELINKIQGTANNFDYGVNFSTHNMCCDLVLNTAVASKTVDGEKCWFNINGDMPVAWYLLASMIPFNRLKLYKLYVKNFTGYGRMGITSYDNGGALPGVHQYRNAAGMPNDDNIFNSDSPAEEHIFYIIPPSSSGSEIVYGGLHWCSDLYRDTLGAAGFSFEIGLYEQEDLIDNISGDSLLKDTIYRYKNKIIVNSTVIDTGIPQSILSGKGFTAAFVFMSDTWTNFYGLFGMHNGSVVDTHGLCCQYGDGHLSLVLPNCRGDCDVAPPSGEKTIFILSDSADKSYIYYNGVRHDIIRYSDALPFVPLNNICLLRSFSGGGNERYYHGTIYDIALFDRGLSDNECAALTNYFAGLYDIKI